MCDSYHIAGGTLHTHVRHVYTQKAVCMILPMHAGERRLARCMQGRSLLLMGSGFNVDLRKGFARVNTSLAAWTRVPPGPLHPNRAEGPDPNRAGALRTSFRPHPPHATYMHACVHVHAGRVYFWRAFEGQPAHAQMHVRICTCRCGLLESV